MKMNELKYFIVVMFTAISANLYCASAKLDYMQSLVMGMGLPLTVAYIMGRKNFGMNELKTLISYELVFIIPTTILIEKVMLYFQSWGFSKEST